MPACDICSFPIARSTDMARHRNGSLCQKVARLIADREAQIVAKDNEIAELTSALERTETQVVTLTERAERAEAIVEKLALRPTNATTIHHRNRNNYLQYLSAEPIKFSSLETQMPKFVTAEALMKGERCFNAMIASTILEDDEGKTKVVCTDQARKQFSYKDEKSGELISDPSLERLRKRMRSGVDYGTLFDEVLEELDSEGGDTTGNAEQAHLILNRAKFPGGFVNHMARRTYKGAIIQFDDEPD